MTIKNPQDNALVNLAHQIILNMLVTKNISNKVFDYIDPWGEPLAYILWDIRASYYQNIQSTPGQAIFDRYMISNLVSVVDWCGITSTKQRKVDINNVQENIGKLGMTTELLIWYIWK